MTADVVIRAEGLGKKYLIGHQDAPERYQSLRDSMVRGVRNFTRSTRDLALGRQLIDGDRVEDFWALRDLEFEIRRGEVVGIIGRNGAGKSTLLKVLSRITEPSEGRVEIRGRVASLLEVGTGFHPELTGRENIYLNGAILGMDRAEIKSKFDEIVAFAEIEQFLDTPVKRYSSGMYVRLAFAVAAHLEPEILVVDEVLAVGDAEFQKKCLGKMQNSAGRGRTVLFVSHNMAALRSLCPQAIWLAKGRKVAEGDSRTLVADYLSQGSATLAGLQGDRDAGAALRLEGIDLADRRVVSRGPMSLSLQFEGLARGVIRECALLVHSLSGERVGIIDLRETRLPPLRHGADRFTVEIEVDSLPLVEGAYILGLYLVTNDFGGELTDLMTFDVAPEARDFTPYLPQHRGILALKSSARMVAATDTPNGSE